MERILILHAAAIGDSVLGTPVSASLKEKYPSAKITCLTHESLIPLLSICPSIDELIALDEVQPIISARASIGASKPDLIVDLSGSSKSFWQTLFMAKKVLRYQKQSASARPVQHAVDNYLATVSSVCDKPDSSKLFPTLFPKESDTEKVRKMIYRENKRLLALIPGVGAQRPHRAWPEERWIALTKHILWEKDHALILLGGPEERTLCSRITEKAGEYCFNLAGKLSLAETAAALSLCDATVSGDTGPAHISTAVGTPVVGVYGPTLVERSGPYGMCELALSASDKCQCFNRKSCVLVPDASGKCMGDIQAQTVYANLSSLFPWNRLLNKM